jgi:hypothetical protein
VSLKKRLTRTETLLTPKQAVLLWLKEVQESDLDEHLARALTAPLLREFESQRWWRKQCATASARRG